ncbi:SPOR domain-containing protein [Pseudomonas sp. LPB0260]|uniref:SPOR domain-containing protein n=1 Tax=Pseudomonas sp. LPB0260 TaxID=2614442 RepID=UPI0015C20088|nr:AAA family ATPase [Pseudomonas sp. LPB0260]QLC73497.1 SPOR domain-containing protein [Pseudomonas sp. LPB0260]QLC76271.1 SPOR domain-containing protein [Pseudomonas sp. LPB0260]
MTSLHADEAFLDHYQFSHDPFAARVPGFKFFPAQRKPVLGQLHHLARYSQLLLVVTGPLGSGKTLLRQALVASTNKQAVHSVVLSARGAAEPGAVLRQVAQGLHIQQADPSAILAQVGQLALTGQEVYVLVDDAEQLSDAALASLLALAEGNAEGRAHVFLFAEPQLVARLEALVEGEECFHALALQPYSEDETRAYLAQRLEGAGQGIELLSDQQVAQIHEHSAGWPGGINESAREALIEAMLAQKGATRRAGVGLNLPRKHLLALVVVAVGVLAAWLMQGQSGGDLLAPATAQLPLGQGAQPAVSADAAPAVAPVEAPAIEFAGASQPLPLPLVGEAQPVIRQPLAQAAGLSSAEEVEGAVDEILVSVEADPVPVAPVTPKPLAAAPVVAAAPAAPVVKPVAPPAPAPAPAPVERKVAAAAPVQAPAVAGWYAAQAPSRYTLQVLGARAESSAQAFVREHGGEYHYFKKLHQGQPLYVVTYGSFATREAAQAALRGLPAKVQAGKPWPRTFASIKQEIASAR